MLKIADLFLDEGAIVKVADHRGKEWYMKPIPGHWNCR